MSISSGMDHRASLFIIKVWKPITRCRDVLFFMNPNTLKIVHWEFWYLQACLNSIILDFVFIIMKSSLCLFLTYMTDVLYMIG